jgi:hypothetical protein
MMNNEMNNNVVVAPESQGLVKSIVSNQRVQGGAIVLGAAALGFALYKGYKYVKKNWLPEEVVVEVTMPKKEDPKAEPKAEPKEKVKTVEAEVVDDKSAK